MLSSSILRANALAWAGALLFALAGCGGAAREVRVMPAFASPDTPYGAMLPRYTRAAELYRGFDTVAKAWVTWRTPALREALTETAIAAYRLGEDEADAMRREQSRAARRVLEFHVALFTGKPGWSDLESPDSLWRASLVMPSGDALSPIQIVRLPKTDRSAVEYPYVSRWTREYSIFFPIVSPGEQEGGTTLTLSGPLGAMTFPF